jgi:hypothetical protein
MLYWTSCGALPQRSISQGMHDRSAWLIIIPVPFF